MRYPWDQCDYAAITAVALIRHKHSKHEGLEYLCDQYDHLSKFSTLSLSKFGTLLILNI